MLVGGAECGPSNPLQGLSKRFDHDRGIQQVNFQTIPKLNDDCRPCIGLLSFSKRCIQGCTCIMPCLFSSYVCQVFRTQPEIVLRDQDASRFFAGAVPSPLASQLAADAAIYDISAMQAALPAHAPQQLKPVASWATDFVQQSAPLLNSNVPLEADARRAPAAAVSGMFFWAFIFFFLFLFDQTSRYSVLDSESDKFPYEFIARVFTSSVPVRSLGHGHSK